MYLEQVSKDYNSDDGGFTKLPNNFLKKWTKTLGKGPVLLYLQLCTYCHKNNAIAWPALKTLGDDLGMSKNSVINYQKILLRNGLIQKIKRRKHNGNYHSNLYRVTPITGTKNGPDGVQKLDLPSPTFGLYQVQNLHPNKNNKNKNHRTTTREDVVVNFKKRKDKGEEKMTTIRERMREFDFTESFTEKVLKEYPLEKVAEKLELYAEGREVRNPAGWFMAALKEGYGEDRAKDKDDVSSLRFRMDSCRRGNDISCSMGLPRHFIPRNDREKENINDGNTGLPRHFVPRNDRCKSQNENERTLSREEAIKWIRTVSYTHLTLPTN